MEIAGTKTVPDKKHVEADLYIILVITFLTLGVYMAFSSWFDSIIDNKNIHILARTLLAAFVQFGMAGLGITVVSVIRKESFLKHGLNRNGVLTSIVLSVLAYVPYTVFAIVSGNFEGYLPFGSVLMTKEIVSAGFPVNAAGMLLVTAAWGFFEGFNYVVISDKLNIIFPSKNKWLSWGAAICGVMCILIHGMIGVNLENIIEMVTVFIIIYGMLLVRERTGNAWGCVFIFIFLWNAF